jgi:hypothetical protein
MTTLLQEFEEWLKETYDRASIGDYCFAISQAIDKLEELKKKHGVL